MTTTDWIIDIALILIVLRQMREERLTLLFVLVPLGLVGYTAHLYLHSVPTGGNDLVLIGLSVLTGALLGAAGGLVTRVRAKDGHAMVQAGPAAAALWIGSMTARLGFIIWITHSSGAQSLGRFSLAHHITGGDVWQTALILLALSEVIVRIAIICIRGRLVLSAPAATPERASVTV